MNTKKDKAKKGKIKNNSKKALEYMKSKNPHLQYLIEVLDLELLQDKQLKI